MRDEQWSLVDAAEGWLRRAEAGALYELAAGAAPGTAIVEVGSYQGRSTIALALGAMESGAVIYAVDPHDPYTEPTLPDVTFGPGDSAAFLANIVAAGVAGSVFVVNLRSDQAARVWDRVLAGVYVDGCHEAEAVAADAAAWQPHLAAGGWLAFHDRRWPGVAAVIDELIAGGWAAETVDQLAVLRRANVHRE